MIPQPPRRRGAKIDKRYSSVAWRRVRAAIRLRDGATCQECGRRAPAVRLVVDHRTPPDRYRGAFTDPGNLWTLCHGCNVSKGDLTVEEWHAALQRRGARPGRPVPAATPDTWARSEADDARPFTADAGFLPWASQLHGVSSEPAEHGHPRWEVAITCTYRRESFRVCPRSCSSPVRWPH